MTHPAFSPGAAAVITGAASGIGLAMAERCASLGMALALADVDEEGLERARDMLKDRAAGIMALVTDVSDAAQVIALRDAAFNRFGPVTVLMNNAGREGGGTLAAGPERWRQIIDTNLWGVVNGVQAFTDAMVAQNRPGAIINTGSKQGITTPPGDTAYNVSKAGIKVVTEALAHDLRAIPGCQVTAHLLIPGFTFTGFTRVHTATKPDAAWTPEQVIDRLLAGLDAGDFYVLCPDNAVTPEMDAKRIRWAAEDVVSNRPALSRWHPDYAKAFDDYMKS